MGAGRLMVALGEFVSVQNYDKRVAFKRDVKALSLQFLRLKVCAADTPQREYTRKGSTLLRWITFF